MPIRGESVGTAFVRIIGDGDGLRSDINDDLDDLDEDFDRAGKRHGKKYKKGFDDEMDKKGFFRKLANRFETLSEPLGRLFGRGSRNNFLNFFGSVVTNILNTTGRVVDFFETVINGFKQIGSVAFAFFKEFFRQGSEAAGVAERFSLALAAAGAEGTLTTLVTGGLNLVAGLVAITAALAVAAIAAGALVSALLLLSGVVIALAGTIYASLIAAVAAFAPLILPLAAVILGVVAAVKEFKDASGELGTAIDKVKSKAKNLFQQFKDRAFRNAPRLTERIADAMKRLGPITVAAGKGFNRFVTEAVRSLTSPAFDAFTDRFARFLPHAMKDLGTVFTNVFEGLAGLLRASIPLANQLLGWLVKITDNFSTWANSKAGQKEIRQFLKDAADSARSLGHFLGEATGLIQDLLLAGQSTGNSIFDDMADSLARVRGFLKDNPDALKNFFADSKDFADSLGRAIRDIVRAIDRIDTPETRRAASALVEIFGGMIALAGSIISLFTTIGAVALDMLKIVVSAFAILVTTALSSLSELAKGVGFLAEAIPGPIGEGLRAATGAFTDFSEGAIARIGQVQQNVDNLGKTIAKAPVMDIDTSPAVAKLSALGALLNQIQTAINNVNAHHVAQGGGQDTGQGQHGGGSQPVERGSSPRLTDGMTANITVVTPTTDPVAVANELLNRLAVVGY